MDKKNVNSTLSAAFGLKPEEDEKKSDKTRPMDFNAAFGLRPEGEVPALEAEDFSALEGQVPGITMDINSAFGLPEDPNTRKKSKDHAESTLDVGPAFGLPANKKDKGSKGE